MEHGGPGPREAVRPRGGVMSGVGVGEVLAEVGAAGGQRADFKAHSTTLTKMGFNARRGIFYWSVFKQQQ